MSSNLPQSSLSTMPVYSQNDVTLKSLSEQIARVEQSTDQIRRDLEIKFVPRSWFWLALAGILAFIVVIALVATVIVLLVVRSGP